MADDERLYFPDSAWLTDEQRKQALAWLVEKWKGADCPYHADQTTWSIGPFLAGIPGHIPPGKRSIGQVYPAVVVICQTCGHMVWVNSNFVGISGGPADEKAEDGPEPEQESEQVRVEEGA